MARETSEEKRLTEDEIARRILGPRGVPGDPDTAKMTPQQEKNIPKTGDFDGHTVEPRIQSASLAQPSPAIAWSASRIFDAPRHRFWRRPIRRLWRN
jgi:hypothetical protein